MSRSTFDPNAFLETNFPTGFDTNYVNPDEGEYVAQITEKMSIRQGESDGRPWASVDITWELMDDSARKRTNMEHPTARQSFFLDFDDAGVLDLSPNRNMKLKRLFDATGLNKKNGKVNMAMLKFQSAYIKVEHVPDTKDPEIVYANVTRVAPLDKARAA